MMLKRISRGAIIAIVMVGLILTVTTTGLLSISQSIQSSGTVTAVNLGVYSDSGCTIPKTSIDWGSISPGNTITSTVYVKNTGNVPITLSMTKTGWNPTSANGPITVTWNKESTTLAVGQSVAAVLTLSVSSGISGITTFSVNIVITGTG